MTKAIRQRVAESLREQGYDLRNEAVIETSAFEEDRWGSAERYDEGANLVKRIEAEYLIRAADLLDRDTKKVTL